MRLPVPLLATLLALGASATAAAQQFTGPVFSLEGGASYLAFSGDDFEGLDAAPGFFLGGALRVSENFALAAGWQRTSHGSEVCDDTACLDEDVVASQFYAEPRLLFPTGSNLTPYLGARAGYVKLSADVVGFDFEETGWFAGIVGGLQVHFNPSLGLDLGAGIEQLWLGDAKVQGISIDESDSSGQGIVVRAGLTIALGGGQ